MIRRDRFAFLLLQGLLLDGCGPSAGTGRIQSARDAPWKPGRVHAHWQEWTTEVEPDSGGDSHYKYYSRSSGLGLLFLMDAEDLSCERLREDLWLEDLEALGRGLIIAVTYQDTAWDEEVLDEDLGFEGTYFGHKGTRPDSKASREMTIFAVQNGFMTPLSFTSSGVDGAWTTISAASRDGVEGEFYAEFWEGSFNALHCGDFAQTAWFAEEDG